MDRVTRLLRLVTLLQSSQNRSADDLVDILGVSRRTLFRDLKTLQEAGVPCYHDASKGYRISERFFLPPINLTVSETLGLLLLGKVAAAQRGRPLANQALSGIQKLITTLPEPIRATCAEMMANVTIDPAAQAIDGNETQWYVQLHEAIDAGKVCQVDYQGPLDDAPTQMQLRPYALHFSQRAWYVMGHVDEHEEVRILKLGRIQNIALLDVRFDRPTQFSPSDKIGKAWQMIAEGTIYEVELEFSARVAVNVTEVNWHQSQSHEFLDDGRVLVRFEVDGLSEIAWWICGYADHVKVIDPPELRERVGAMLRRAAEQYGANDQ